MIISYLGQTPSNTGIFVKLLIYFYNDSILVDAPYFRAFIKKLLSIGGSKLTL